MICHSVIIAFKALLSCHLDHCLLYLRGTFKLNVSRVNLISPYRAGLELTVWSFCGWRLCHSWHKCTGHGVYSYFPHYWSLINGIHGLSMDFHCKVPVMRSLGVSFVVIKLFNKHLNCLWFWSPYIACNVNEHSLCLGNGTDSAPT